MLLERLLHLPPATLTPPAYTCLLAYFTAVNIQDRRLSKIGDKLVSDEAHEDGEKLVSDEALEDVDKLVSDEALEDGDKLVNNEAHESRDKLVN